MLPINDVLALAMVVGGGTVIKGDGGFWLPCTNRLKYLPVRQVT